MLLCKTKQGYLNLNNVVKLDFYCSENDFAKEDYEKWECFVEFDSTKIKTCSFESQKDAISFVGKIQKVVVDELMLKYYESENEINLTEITTKLLEDFCS